jgi:hypothetical protein
MARVPQSWSAMCRIGLAHRGTDPKAARAATWGGSLGKLDPIYNIDVASGGAQGIGPKHHLTQSPITSARRF